jgi:ATP-dependent RNA helicase DDX60
LVSPGFAKATASAHLRLNEEEIKARLGFQYITLGCEFAATVSDDALLGDITTLYLASNFSAEAPAELLFAFLAHSILLETVSVEDRAQHIAPVHSGLTKVILNNFLPAIFLAVENAVSSCGAFCRIDGRIYLALVHFLMDNPTIPMHELLDISICDRVQNLWSRFNLLPVDFGALATRFPNSSSTPQNAVVVPKALRLLPFDNTVFNSELSSVQITCEDENDEILDAAPQFNFGQGVLFSDTHHWHNSKAILPRHLGGEDSKPKNEWHRRRILKSEQRFMATLQRQAGTLTGALGASLAQIVIPPVGSRSAKPKGKGNLVSSASPRDNVGAQKLYFGERH